MDSDALLHIARETIEKLKFCFACTLAEDGTVNARVIQPGKLAEDWSVRFMTLRSTRKIQEMERTGRLTLGYLYEPEGTHVTLLGRPRIIDDVAAKRAVWGPAADEWYSGGPEDPNVVLVELATERIELWSKAHDVMPEPRGFSSAVLERHGEGWHCSQT